MNETTRALLEHVKDSVVLEPLHFLSERLNQPEFSPDDPLAELGQWFQSQDKKGQEMIQELIAETTVYSAFGTLAMLLEQPEDSAGARVQLTISNPDGEAVDLSTLDPEEVLTAFESLLENAEPGD